VRISLANLDDDTYGTIGKKLREVCRRYVEEWKAGREGGGS
jgi:hypothetical protein